MNPINLISDSYERQARLYPALLLIMPMVLTCMTLFKIPVSDLRSLAGIGMTLGGLFFLSQLARDSGKRMEKKLFESWGGAPSITIFRYRDKKIDPYTKKRYQNLMAKLVSGTKAQSVKLENGNPERADQIYSAWSNYLRSNTRDVKKYSLLFKENINYGYRRNVLGIRLFGLISSFVCVLANSFGFYRIYIVTGNVDQGVLASLIFSCFFLLLWTFRFNKDWVSIPAIAYSERLLETIETLSKKARH